MLDQMKYQHFVLACGGSLEPLSDALKPTFEISH